MDKQRAQLHHLCMAISGHHYMVTDQFSTILRQAVWVDVVFLARTAPVSCLHMIPGGSPR